MYEVNQSEYWRTSRWLFTIFFLVLSRLWSWSKPQRSIRSHWPLEMELMMSAWYWRPMLALVSSPTALPIMHYIYVTCAVRELQSFSYTVFHFRRKKDKVTYIQKRHNIWLQMFTVWSSAAKYITHWSRSRACPRYSPPSGHKRTHWLPCLWLELLCCCSDHKLKI